MQGLVLSRGRVVERRLDCLSGLRDMSGLGVEQDGTLIQFFFHRLSYNPTTKFKWRRSDKLAMHRFNSSISENLIFFLCKNVSVIVALFIVGAHSSDKLNELCYMPFTS